MKIQDIILIIFFILAVVFVFGYIIGGSPTFEQAILILILGFVISNTVNIRELKIRFKALASDFKEHMINYHKK